MRIAFTIWMALVTFSASSQAIVTEIEVIGAERTRPSFILNIVRVEKGAQLDSLILQNDIQRLKRLPSISNAEFEVIQIDQANCRVKFEVVENFTLIPFANLFSSSNDDFAFRVGLQEFNLLGRNITVGGFYQYDIFNSYGLQLKAPNLFGRRFGLAIDYKDLTTQEPVFFDNTTAEYKYNNQGFEIMGLYEINFKNRIGLGFSLFTEDYEYISGAMSPEVPLGLNVDKHLLKFMYNYDNLNYFYQYLEGFRSTLNLQYVGSSDTMLPEFVIGFNDFAYFRRVGQRGNWANRLRLGLASNINTPFAPFTVDNNLNIRGVGNVIDRGTGAIVFNTEYRHTLIDKNWFVLQSNVFVDGGSWRNPGGDFGDFADSQNVRIYPGVGIRFIHKRIFNAILRIDYGYGITKDASRGIVFGIGQYF
ncbi:MAG: outer membrane protein assembly factor [Aurantibacter sp.]